ncbi:polysaccharide deacetylase [Afipia sp. Root123D2]|uniref:polysaccharide deacetylase family protein n=1 Tax=Afipia sp. Root123D2 TaxID=1736436 RepID=UPI0006F4C6EC|nr:polysaccharide deacetylase family protein [Afipia sp. Root123D2]KQW22694.1 polysaccharide deacetylase [Afipia sp. Root123D2]
MPSVSTSLCRAAAVAACAIVLAASNARAESCANPNALGTSRTLVVDPAEHRLIGSMQYPETLPLRDHEVVLTFDDGPLPKHTKPILATLAAECVKATFFIVGQMATAYPETLREVYAAGHTIGTHTQHHPLGMNKMPLDKAEAEIADGITSTAAALGNPAEVAPFVRIPGLRRSPAIEGYLASKGLMAWSADFPADDWHHISSAKVVQTALTRLEAKGRGVLLLHDIQQRTQDALPVILRELKARGYRIVHVVPATAKRPKTPTQPWQWHISPSDPSLISAAPEAMRFVFTPPKAHPSAVAKVNAVSAVSSSARRGKTHARSDMIWLARTGAARPDAAARLLSPVPVAFQLSGQQRRTHTASGDTLSRR